MGFVKEASNAIRNTLVMCRDDGDFDIAKNAIIEFCSAFGMSDGEIIQALTDASGNSAVEDEAIDCLISAIG